MNWILCPLRNGRHLTQAALKTFLAQDVGDIGVLFIVNSPTDGTTEWLYSLADPRVHTSYRTPPLCVSASWNAGLKWIFGHGDTYALVVNNDVELRLDTYRELLAANLPFATAVGVATKEQRDAPYARADRPHPDFSCFLIRKEAYEKTGKFDEGYGGGYGEDADYHLRMHKAGINATCVGIPFLHHACGTIKNASPEEAERIRIQADKNRAHFKQVHGMEIGSPEYYAMFNTTAEAVAANAEYAKWEATQPKDPWKRLGKVVEPQSVLGSFISSAAFEKAWGVMRVIPGTFSKEEAELLWECMAMAPAGTFMEVGVWFGRSTSLIANFCAANDRYLFAVDPFVDNGELARPSALNVLGSSHCRYDLYEKRTVDLEPPAVAYLSIALLHLDGCHKADGITVDCERLLPQVVPGGIVLAHDYGREGAEFADVKPTIDKYLKDWHLIGVRDTLAAFQRPSEPQSTALASQP